jgi:hypothetical protein
MCSDTREARADVLYLKTRGSISPALGDSRTASGVEAAMLDVRELIRKLTATAA